MQLEVAAQRRLEEVLPHVLAAVEGEVKLFQIVLSEARQLLALPPTSPQPRSVLAQGYPQVSRGHASSLIGTTKEIGTIRCLLRSRNVRSAGATVSCHTSSLVPSMPLGGMRRAASSEKKRGDVSTLRCNAAADAR